MDKSETDLNIALDFGILFSVWYYPCQRMQQKEKSIDGLFLT